MPYSFIYTKLPVILDINDSGPVFKNQSSCYTRSFLNISENITKTLGNPKVATTGRNKTGRS
jgi:hypothetical protein